MRQFEPITALLRAHTCLHIQWFFPFFFFLFELMKELRPLIFSYPIETGYLVSNLHLPPHRGHNMLREKLVHNLFMYFILFL